MGLVLKGLLGLIFGLVGYTVYIRLNAPLPEVPVYSDTWWGKGEKGNDDEAIRPFKVDVSKDVSIILFFYSS